MSAPDTVLLVEDDPSDAGLVRAWLENASPGRFRVEHVERLAQARVRAADRAFDATILDLGLPDSRGVDTVARFRHDDPHGALVVLTGDDDDRLVAAVMGRGADELLHKDDANPTRLAAAIDSAIARHRREIRFAALAQELRGQLLVLSRALDGHPDAVVAFDESGTIHFANLAARILLGLRDGDQLPGPLLYQRPDKGWSGTVSVQGADGRTIRVSVLRRPLVTSNPAERGGVLLARIVEPDLQPLRPSLEDALVLIGGADALLERATLLVRRTASLTASAEEAIALPLTAHMLALDLVRLALGLEQTIGAAKSLPRVDEGER